MKRVVPTGVVDESEPSGRHQGFLSIPSPSVGSTDPHNLAAGEAYMLTPMIDWRGICTICPKETERIHSILSEYDIEVVALIQAVAGQREWHDVVDLHDCHLEIGEHEEASQEDAIIERLQEAWESLASAFELATAVEGSGLRLSESDYRFDEGGASGSDGLFVVVSDYYAITPAGRKFEKALRLL
jgi:hypothetical protein